MSRSPFSPGAATVRDRPTRSRRLTHQPEEAVDGGALFDQLDHAAGVPARQLVGVHVREADAVRGRPGLHGLDPAARQPCQMAGDGIRHHADVLQSAGSRAVERRVDARRRVVLADQLDLDRAPLPDRDREVDLRRTAPVLALRECDVLEQEKRPDAEGGPVPDGRFQVRHDEAELHRGPEGGLGGRARHQPTQS
jgi:hypothetical protein